MKIVMMGSGYVGLTSGVCFAELGHQVTCVDVNSQTVTRLNAGEVPFYEPGLSTLLEKSLTAKRFSSTIDAKAALEIADLAFICVGTPTSADGTTANLSYVLQAAQTCLTHLPQGATLAVKSTVPLGTNAKLLALQKELGRTDLSIASNPEFLREGSAVRDFVEPDRIVIGVHNAQAEAALRKAYSPMTVQGYPMVVTSVESAELGKYAANAFLATKITFANDLARICSNSGASMTELREILGSDQRIGGAFLMQGPGYGGSCFPKDTRALTAIGSEYAAPQGLIEAVIIQNEAAKASVATRILQDVSTVSEKKIGLLGLTFKENTDDMREASSLTITAQLTGKVKELLAYDPMFLPPTTSPITGVRLTNSVQQLMQESDAIVILNHYPEAKPEVTAHMQGKQIFDYRSMFAHERYENVFVFGQ